MRKIESAMLNAVRARKNWKQDNTEVHLFHGTNGCELAVYLHDNCICKVVNESGKMSRYFSFAGWDTATTRSRLRALGVNIVSKNGSRYVDGQEIDTRWGNWYAF